MQEPVPRTRTREHEITGRESRTNDRRARASARVRPLALLLCLTWQALDGARAQAPAGTTLSAPPSDRVDYLTLAQGALPVRVTGAGAQLGAGDEQALRAIDGNASPFTLVAGAKAATDTELVYELPALTTFDRFAVPNVIDAPSLGQTFVRDVAVLGSAVGPDAGYVTLASATLTPHVKRGEVTDLPLAELRAVRWIKLRLVGRIDMAPGEAVVEFSELVGNGAQEPVAASYRFRGEWLGGGVSVALRQTGAVVSGCYDTGGELSGTVSGNILRATGVTRTEKVASVFVLGIAADGTLRGVRSTNRGLFRLYTAPKTAPGSVPRCTPPPPRLACGSIIHAITFDPGSATLRPDAVLVLPDLVQELQASLSASASVVIESHTSNQRPAVENLALSQQRAQAVVDLLAKRGLGAQGLRAVGVGQARPLASNDDAQGRALNERIEVRCP